MINYNTPVALKNQTHLLQIHLSVEHSSYMFVGDLDQKQRRISSLEGEADSHRKEKENLKTKVDKLEGEIKDKLCYVNGSIQDS